MGKRKTTEEFIKDAVKYHGGRYDYSKVEYLHSKSKVVIICRKHGPFEQRCKNHLKGQGCPKCAGNVKSNIKEFILKSKKVHGDKYDYSNSKYSNSKTKMSIICVKHGTFYKKPNDHLMGSGCPQCSRLERPAICQVDIPTNSVAIPISADGKFTIIDADDYGKIKDILWSISKAGYVVNKSVGFMHRFIIDAPSDMLVDHINHNRTDNRKSNLRLATHSQNNFNRRPLSGSSSKYKGVTWERSVEKWSSRISYKGSKITIGRFATEEEAARAFDLKAIELRGEWAYQTLNFPENKEEYLKQIENGG